MGCYYCRHECCNFTCLVSYHLDFHQLDLGSFTGLQYCEGLGQHDISGGFNPYGAARINAMNFEAQRHAALMMNYKREAAVNYGYDVDINAEDCDGHDIRGYWQDK